MEITRIDKFGRLVIPEEIRKNVGITEASYLLITDIDKETVVIRKLDREEVARRLREVVREVD